MKQPERMSFAIQSLGLVLLACSAISCRTTHRPDNASENWPTLTQAMTPDSVDVESIRRLTQHAKEPLAVWLDVVDIDRDLKADAILTVAHDEAAGARGRLVTHKTFVLLGQQPPHHVLELRTARLWFSLPSLWHLNHAVYPDIKIRRHFFVFRKVATWWIQIHEVEYTNSAGDSSMRGFYLARSADSIVAVENLAQWNSKLDRE